MKKVSFLARFRSAIMAHKIITSIVIVAVLGGGYYIYKSAKTANAAPQYQVARARNGNIVQTVTGSGQVSAANQLDVTSQVSGTIQTIDVSVGQQVKSGQLLATIDPTNALNSLNNAKLSLEKMTEAPKATDLSNAQNSVSQSYSTAFNDISGLFIDLQTVMPGLNSMFYGQQQFLDPVSSENLNPTSKTYRDTAAAAFDQANAQYQSLQAEYHDLSRSSASSTVDQTLNDSYTLAKQVSAALQGAQTAITFITTNQTSYMVKIAPTSQSNVTTWSNLVDGDVASLLSAENGIASAENSLTNLVVGSDPLDVQGQELAVQQQEQTYANYFIRAPFDGIIGRIPVSVYGQAGGSTVIATVIGTQKIATLSLNEVDAAKVKAGDQVSLTFDAINNFTATGTVAEVDLVGTVSQGVVTYGVKVNIDTSDSRIIPGMSVNATITTSELDNVLVVPSSAIKSQGNTSYVQVFSSLPQSALAAGAGASGTTSARTRGSSASSTGAFGSGAGASNGQSGTASTTRQFTGAFGSGAAGGRSLTITFTSATPPTNTPVTIGASDDTNTQIVSGLTSGAWVVTKTVAASAQTAAAAPSILNSLGGGARAGAGAGGLGGGATFRAGGAGGGAAGGRGAIGG